MSPVFAVSRFRPQGICAVPFPASSPPAPCSPDAQLESADALAARLRRALEWLQQNNHPFDLAFLCGGDGALQGLREATATFPLPIHIALEPQFISLSAAPILRQQLAISSSQPLWIVDLGHSHLKISLQSRHTTRCVFSRPLDRLPFPSCPTSLPPAAIAQRCLDWLAECLGQVRVRTEPRCHLVVGLPCQIDDALNLTDASYPGWTPKSFGHTIAETIGHAIFSQGCLVQSATVLSDAELAACGAIAQLSREGATYNNALVLRLGTETRAAILSQAIPRHAFAEL